MKLEGLRVTGRWAVGSTSGHQRRQKLPSGRRRQRQWWREQAAGWAQGWIMQGLAGNASANSVINASFITAVMLLPAAPSTQASQDRVQSPERHPGRELREGKPQGRRTTCPKVVAEQSWEPLSEAPQKEPWSRQGYSRFPTWTGLAYRSRSEPGTLWTEGRCWGRCSWNTVPDRPCKDNRRDEGSAKVPALPNKGRRRFHLPLRQTESSRAEAGHCAWLLVRVTVPKATPVPSADGNQLHPAPYWEWIHTCSGWTWTRSRCAPRSGWCSLPHTKRSYPGRGRACLWGVVRPGAALGRGHQPRTITSWPALPKSYNWRQRAKH